MILNLTCHFCLAQRRVEFACDESKPNDLPPEFRKVAEAWMLKHRKCAPKGADVLVEATGQTSEEAPKMPIVAAVIRGQGGG